MMKKYCLTITMTIDRSEYCRKNPVNLVDRLAETGQEHRHRLRSKGSTSAGEEQLQLFVVCTHDAFRHTITAWVICVLAATRA